MLRVYCCLVSYFCLVPLDHFVPLLLLFVQQSRTEKQTVNVAGAQKRVWGSFKAKTNQITSNNHNTVILHSQFCSKHILVLKNFKRLSYTVP